MSSAASAGARRAASSQRARGTAHTAHAGRPREGQSVVPQPRAAEQDTEPTATLLEDLGLPRLLESARRMRAPSGELRSARGAFAALRARLIRRLRPVARTMGTAVIAAGTAAPVGAVTSWFTNQVEVLHKSTGIHVPGEERMFNHARPGTGTRGSPDIRVVDQRSAPPRGASAP